MVGGSFGVGLQLAYEAFHELVGMLLNHFNEASGKHKAPPDFDYNSPSRGFPRRIAHHCSALRTRQPVDTRSVPPIQSDTGIMCNRGLSLEAVGRFEMISFYNTLSGRVEEFVPIEPGHARIYTCGPTVYDYAHIGNYRTFVFGDVLRRHLRRSGFKLLHVMNITDVDDKTIRNAAAAGLPLKDYTERYIEAFLEDAAMLRLERPEKLVRATDHIPEMVEAIRKLGEKGLDRK